METAELESVSSQGRGNGVFVIKHRATYNTPHGTAWQTYIVLP
jgi:hypothetical protein